MKNRFTSIAVFALAIAPTALLASPITTLYSTGLDGAGNPSLTTDAHYAVLGGNGQAELRSPLPSTYLPNDAASGWIWQFADGNPINTTLTFRTTFDLTGYDALTASISGLWGTDNQGLDILVNGTSSGNKLLGVVVDNFSALHAFTLTSGFIAGINTLDFIVRDDGVVGAFRAQLTGNATLSPRQVPEPGTLFLLGVGLAVLGTLTLRRGARRARQY